MRRGPWRWTDDGWRHAPWWKVAANTLLRALQPRRRRKLVVFTSCRQQDGPDDPKSPPEVLGYGLGFVDHRS